MMFFCLGIKKCLLMLLEIGVSKYDYVEEKPQGGKRRRRKILETRFQNT